MLDRWQSTLLDAFRNARQKSGLAFNFLLLGRKQRCREKTASWRLKFWFRHTGILGASPIFPSLCHPSFPTRLWLSESRTHMAGWPCEIGQCRGKEGQTLGNLT